MPEPERPGDLVTQIGVDAPAVDCLDDRAQHPPAARRVVAGRRARLPERGSVDRGCDRLLPRDVPVVRRVAGHRETTGVREHVAERAPLLPVVPAVDVLGDEIIEADAVALPLLEQRDRRPWLARGVPEHDVVRLQRPSRVRLADGGVDERLAPHGDVELRAGVPALFSALLEQLERPPNVFAHGVRG